MGRWARVVAVAGIVVGALVGASSASAIYDWPRHVGDPCAASGAAPAQTAIVLSTSLRDVPAVELSTVVPGETPSVITRWKVNVPAGMGPIQEQIVTFRAVGEQEDQLIGESAPATVVGGAENEFMTRIPVPEYASIGLRGPAGALVCQDESLHAAGLVAEPWANGETRRFTIEEDTGVPVVATLEPDRDGDGYGDETQDGCVYLVAVQTACPFVVLRPEARVFRRGILVEVSTGDPTRVEVSGQVGWGYRPRGGGPSKRLVVGLETSGQEVGAGATVPFWVPLPTPVTRRLATLSPKEKLKAHLTIVAFDVTGRPTTREMTVRLPGWDKHKETRNKRSSHAQSSAAATATLPG